jgi:hypothetical protein
MNCINPGCNRPVPSSEKRRFCRPVCYVEYPDGREKTASRVMPGFFDEDLSKW